MELDDRDIVIVIRETGKQFKCTLDWTIGKAEDAIRSEFVLIGGAININNTSIRSGKSFAEEIQRVTCERIENLQFAGERIINREGNNFIFTFVNGENFLFTLFIFRQVF